MNGYENIIFKHIIPTIGRLKLQDIKPYNLQKYFDIKNEILSSRTLSNHKRVLSSALIYALDMGLIEKNPLTRVKLPRQKKEETKILNIQECNLLLQKVENNLTSKMPVMLALPLGLRRDETLGLSWDAVDLENKTISIIQNLEYVNGKYYFKEPKTLSSRNTWGTEKNLVCTRKKDGNPITPHVL
ncbi:hypothetical protein CKR_0362 [Clostridium kluyveri NBRC 12016]|uniref:Tyr recombinase domain-containing protein n=1 Tax=Clostridium kluyveri (strain NBRC 12016) TaxID=583346 RepID=B9DYT8_CLOK1|nr:hypothetical protein CKR_0362 [Clostridium kluyveri NBRC 12016]